MYSPSSDHWSVSSVMSGRVELDEDEVEGEGTVDVMCHVRIIAMLFVDLTIIRPPFAVARNVDPGEIDTQAAR